MSSRITVETSIDQDDWNKLVDRVPWATAQHSYGYSRALGKSFGFLQPAYSLFRSGDVAVAGLPLFRFALLGPFRAIYSLPFNMYGGPLVHPDHLYDTELMTAIRQRIDHEAKCFNAFEVGVSFPPGFPNAIIERIFGSNGFLIEKRPCPVLDLNRPLEEITDGFKPAVRRAVAKCHRSGVTIGINPPIDDLLQAYPIYRERMRTLGATVKPWAFIEDLIRGGLAVGFVAKYEGRPLGLVVLLVAGDFSIYWLSAMRPDAARFRVINGLVDATIRWAHEKNFSFFSFGEGHGMGPGVLRFKMGWAPDMCETRRLIKVCRPRVRYVWRVFEPRAREAYALWLRARGYASLKPSSSK